VAATAIIVPFQETERAVDRWRRSHTSDGADGMPPHVTLIYPFVDDAQLVAGQITELRNVLARFSAFDMRFTGFGRFDGPPAVLYLDPDPAQAFLEMIDAIAEQFPEFPPFGGQFDSVVPHLTIAYSDEPAVLDAAEQAVAAHLPISARASEVLVMEHGADDGWRMRHRIALT
jgi:2'-5' RNA ligase